MSAIPPPVAHLLILTALLLSPAAAEPNPLPYDKQAYWFSYFTDLAVNDRVALHFDTSYRLIDDTTWRQWLVRPGVNIDLSQQLESLSHLQLHQGAPKWAWS